MDKRLTVLVAHVFALLVAWGGIAITIAYTTDELPIYVTVWIPFAVALMFILPQQYDELFKRYKRIDVNQVMDSTEIKLLRERVSYYERGYYDFQKNTLRFRQNAVTASNWIRPW